jgi:uncharacterized membrane protein YcaP (DUF421 family)
MDFGAVFQPDTNPVEIFVRGTVVYLFLFVLLRVAKRQAGALGISDLLVIVLIADAAQNAMAGQYTSVTDGLLLVLTIAFWAYALDWIGYHFKPVERLIHPPPLLIVKDGVPDRRNMRAELVTMDELMSHLRAQGIEDVRDVKRAYVEGNGDVTVIKANGDSEPLKKHRAV